MAQQFRTKALENKIASKLTDDGMKWISAALDPFHDEPLMVRGLPDGSQRRTVLQRFEKTVSVSAPAGVTTTWDCHVYNLPILNSSSSATNCNIASDGTYNYCIQNVATTQEIPIAPIMIGKCPTGQATLPFTSGPFVPANLEYQTINPVATSTQNPVMRFIAGGFEVTNTTAEIYRQGMVTAYRQPCEFTRGRMQFKVGAGSTYYNDSSIKAPLPPSVIEDVLYLSDTCQWEAAKGGYSIITFDPEKEVFSQSCGSPLHFQRDVTTAFNIGVGIWESVDPTSAQDFITARPVHCNISGQYYTGLSPQTTLQVSVVYYIEVAPPASDPILAVLAKPSPVYDFRALKAYNEVCASLPAAYPVDMNARGDVWRQIVGTLASLSDFIPGSNKEDSFAAGVRQKLREAHLTITQDQLRRAQDIIAPKQKQKETAEAYAKRLARHEATMKAQVNRIAKIEKTLVDKYGLNKPLKEGDVRKR